MDVHLLRGFERFERSSSQFKFYTKLVLTDESVINYSEAVSSLLWATLTAACAGIAAEAGTDHGMPITVGFNRRFDMATFGFNVEK
jgi:hypothetical protein